MGGEVGEEMKEQIERIHQLLDVIVENQSLVLAVVPEIREVLGEMEKREPTVAEG